MVTPTSKPSMVWTFPSTLLANTLSWRSGTDLPLTFRHARVRPFQWTVVWLLRPSFVVLLPRATAATKCKWSCPETGRVSRQHKLSCLDWRLPPITVASQPSHFSPHSSIICWRGGFPDTHHWIVQTEIKHAPLWALHLTTVHKKLIYLLICSLHLKLNVIQWL